MARKFAQGARLVELFIAKVSDFKSMLALSFIAEQKIAEAIREGKLDNLPGAGKPLILEDLSSVPEDLRMAYKILKNSGFAPPEIEDRKEIGGLLALLENSPDERTRLKSMTRLRVLLAKMEGGATRNAALAANDEYYHKILARLERAEREGAREEG